MKKIFYFTDVLAFLTREEDAINKLRKNLQIFKDHSSDIRLVWHPWSGTEKYLELNHSKVLESYREIVETYCREAWGELDTSSSFSKTKEVLADCNAYYGDVSDLVYEAQNAKIPVMIQNVDC